MPESLQNTTDVLYRKVFAFLQYNYLFLRYQLLWFTTPCHLVLVTTFPDNAFVLYARVEISKTISSLKDMDMRLFRNVDNQLPTDQSSLPRSKNTLCTWLHPGYKWRKMRHARQRRHEHKNLKRDTWKARGNLKEMWVDLTIILKWNIKKWVVCVHFIFYYRIRPNVNTLLGSWIAQTQGITYSVAQSVFSEDLIQIHFFFYGSTVPWGPRPRHFTTLHDHTDRHTTIGRTPLDEGPARRRELYLTSHNTHNRQISMP
jgi:hypothetical protein